MKTLRALPKLLLLPLLLCCSLPVLAQESEATETTLYRADLSPTMAEMARQVPRRLAAPAKTVFPLRMVRPGPAGRAAPQAVSKGSAPFSALPPNLGALPMPQVYTNGTIVDVEGISATTGAPSDANGEAGDTQYVQWVNTDIAVYRKSDGAQLLGPVPGNTVFAGMAGSPGADACRDNNNGDPIVKFDQLAHRWLLTQFAWAPENAATGPYYQCIAVSSSADATGSYYRYVLDSRGKGNEILFNDYAKVGVWPDAYYFTFVMFESTVGAYRGPRACGLERAAMIAGAAAQVRCRDFGTSFGVMLPSDLDGNTAPPKGSPNYLMALDYGADGMGDHLFLWRFSFASNTVSGAIEVPVAPFTIACPSLFGGACIAQPAPGEPLDALGDRLMYRLAYRNFGNREVLLVNHSVQQPGVAADGPVGVRWYEIRNPAGAVAVYQQGTHAPDRNSRWMGSVAMDRMGNIAVGYSVSGPATPPGIRYTGRLRSEPLGRLEAEAVIVNGTGVQVDTFNRWGDYSAMTVDPVNDCGFWYTQQYLAVTGSFNWRTRIAGFEFGNCR